MVRAVVVVQVGQDKQAVQAHQVKVMLAVMELVITLLMLLVAAVVALMRQEQMVLMQ